MTGPDSTPGVLSAFDDLPREQRRKLVLRGALWTIATATVIVVAYFIAPMDRAMSAGTILELVLLALAIFAVIGWQIWRITESPYPTLRAVEALAFIVPAYLVLFASIYHVLNHAIPASFGAIQTKLDSLYFSATVFTTVGFGDITAKTQATRALVLCQMMLDLVLIGLVVRLVTNAIKIGRNRRIE